MWLLILSLIVLATAFSWLVWFVVTLDCDLTLFYSTKFGKPICKCSTRVPRSATCQLVNQCCCCCRRSSCSGSQVEVNLSLPVPRSLNSFSKRKSHMDHWSIEWHRRGPCLPAGTGGG